MSKFSDDAVEKLSLAFSRAILTGDVESWHKAIAGYDPITRKRVTDVLMLGWLRGLNQRVERLEGAKRQTKYVDPKPRMQYRGMYDPDVMVYAVGAGVTTPDGTLWIATRPTCQRPGTAGDDSWTRIESSGSS